jgi:hypothetical protein
LDAQIYKSNDNEGFQGQYQSFLQNVTCTAPERVLDHHIISQAAIPLPGFGMNGKIAYPAGNSTWVDNMHFGIPAFRDAISYMGLDNLRFPGGTIANSFCLYPRRLTFDTNTLQQDYYFINQERSDAELIPPTQQASFFFEGSSMRKDPYMEVDVDAGYLFDEVLVDPEATEKSNRNWDPRKPKLSSDPSLKVYPNPATNHVVLEFRNWGEQVALQLRDASGRLVRDEIITSSKTAYLLDLTALKNGSYTLILRALDGHVTEQRQIEVMR